MFTVTDDMHYRTWIALPYQDKMGEFTYAVISYDVWGYYKSKEDAERVAKYANERNTKVA